MTGSHPAGRRRAGWAALAAGLCASAAGLVLAVQPAGEPADAGTLPRMITRAASPVTDTATDTAADAAANAVTDAAANAVTDAAANAVTDAAANAVTDAAANPAAGVPATGPRRLLPARPARLVIGALRVDAPVDAVGVDAARALAVPADPRRLGWWMGSATPGSTRGTVLLAGHVDTARDGRGALFGLERLAIGSRIELRAGTEVFAYRAVARRSYRKEKLPPTVFRADGPPLLALVTCGGSFRDGVYSHNVVVYAEPAR